MAEPDENGPAFVIDATQPFPKRWASPGGPVNVMCGPVKGYLMARRPGCKPFVIGLWQLLNAEKHPLGPFHPIQKAKRAPLSRHKGKAG